MWCLDNKESLRPANSKVDRPTIQIHRTDENNEVYAKIYNMCVWVQM